MFRDARVDNLAMLDVTDFAGVGRVAEGEFCRDDGIDGREDVRNHVELRDALEQESAFVGSPFLVGEVAVNRFGHVA